MDHINCDKWVNVAVNTLHANHFITSSTETSSWCFFSCDLCMNCEMKAWISTETLPDGLPTLTCFTHNSEENKNDGDLQIAEEEEEGLLPLFVVFGWMTKYTINIYFPDHFSLTRGKMWEVRREQTTGWMLICCGDIEASWTIESSSFILFLRWSYKRGYSWKKLKTNGAFSVSAHRAGRTRWFNPWSCSAYVAVPSLVIFIV